MAIVPRVALRDVPSHYEHAPRPSIRGLSPYAAGAAGETVWSSTVYANWMGETPNYAASLSQLGYAAPNGDKLGSFTTYNASVSYQPLAGLQLSFLVNNLLNEMPPTDDSYPGTSGEPYNTSNYNVYGRSMYLEMRYAFGADK